MNKKVNLIQIYKSDRNFIPNYEPQKEHPKKIILLTTRSRPSDSAANLCIKGFVESYIEELSSLGCFMRQNTMLVVVPLLNPDGVMLGNHAAGVSGHLMSEYLDSESKEIFPELHYLKRYLSKLKTQGDELICSIHFETSNLTHNSYLRSTIPSSSESEKLKKIRLPALMQEWSSFFDIDSCMYQHMT